MDLPRSSPIYYLLAGNIRNKTRPSCQHFHEAWRYQVTELHDQIKYISSRFYRRPAQRTWYKPSSSLLERTSTVALNVFASLRTNEAHLNSRLDALGTSIPFTHEVVRLSKQLRDHLVLSELGKGKGCLHLCCKTVHSDYEKKIFWDNTQYFEVQEHMTPQSTLQLFFDTYDKERWSRFERLVTDDARVPYLYLQPKRKNFEKHRPLASYFKHPLKKVYKVAGQGLMIILQTLQVEHMNLFTTYSTKEKVKEIFGQIDKFESDHGCYPHIDTYAGDVQQLYTELDHDIIVKSIRWAIHEVKSTKSARGRHFVTINKLDKSMSRIGPKYSGQAISQLSFDDILKICLFDAHHAFFEKNGRILRQVKGCPQGAPPSASIAVNVIIYVEHHFFQSIRDDQRFTRCVFTGERFVDDVRNIVLVLPIPAEQNKSQELLQKFVTAISDIGLLLEPEGSFNNQFRFLEGIQCFNDRSIEAAFVSKNYDLVNHQDSYELLAGYPFQTYMESYTDNPRREMENNILTRLYAISAYTLTPKGLILAVKTTMPDFKFSKFPLRSVIRIMKSFTGKLDLHLQEVWRNEIIPSYTSDVYYNIHSN